MNCKEFEGMINDLACEHLMLATKRVQALAHKESCVRCATRLAEERLLTERLRMVADAEVIETPARVKASLMAAFAEQSGLPASSVAAVPVRLEPVRIEPVNLSKPTATNRWSRWAMVAAAAIIVLLAAITIRLLNAGSFVDAAPNTPPRIAEDIKEFAPNVPAPVPAITAPQNKKSVTVAGTHDEKAPVERQVARTDKPRKVPSPTVAGNQIAKNEVVTDYIPLTYINDSTAFDSGSVVRVQVPRSTLVSMGLPMNADSSSALVKADVVVGDDGVARAIRFVHDVSSKADSR